MTTEHDESFDNGHGAVYGLENLKYVISYQNAYNEKINYFKQHYACGQCGNILRKHSAETQFFLGLKYCSCVEKQKTAKTPKVKEAAETPKEKFAKKKKIKLSIEPLSLF
jgi:hypothetical protein